MAVTRSWEPQLVTAGSSLAPPVPLERAHELCWLIAASVAVAAGVLLVALAKTRDFASAHAALASGALLNLNAAALADQNSEAARIHALAQPSRPLPNVGALARLGVPVGRLKSSFVVRTPRQWVAQLAVWTGLYFAAFYAVHLLWRWRRFRGDATLLPALHLLTGMGLMLAVSLRDPLRDTLEFRKFSWGVAVGCGLLLMPLLRAFDYRRHADRIYTPLLASFGLLFMLLAFGHGPTGSQSKVNLGPFQPVELIKILLVVFMSAYFARRWEWMRELRETQMLPRGLRWLDVPRFRHALPVLCAVGCSLILFFVLKDLGPALVTAFLFLTMFAIARARAGLAVAGLVVLVAGIAIGFRAGKPATVVDRISMWLTPWDNNVRGGDQLAHSLWAFATGGTFGSGPGYGDPGMIPAGHTDLVLSAIGEEWGIAGVVAVALLFVFLFRRTVAIARKASDDYGMFLALGFGALIAIEMLLISGGALGVIPLSGVVSPFLSSGNTAMLANFLVFAILAGISSHPRSEPVSQPFERPIRGVSLLLLLCAGGLTAKAVQIQRFAADEVVARNTLVVQADGVRRAQRNPRLNSLAHELTRGTIYDRNGIPLATSRWDELEQHRAAYRDLGIEIDKTCSRVDRRHYPLGPAAAHLTGNFRSGENFHASNASLIEDDQNTRLRGFGDWSELAMHLRDRHHPDDPGMEMLRARDRSVRSSIDARLQLRAAAILERRSSKAALVVMDVDTGDVLALASAPAPRAAGATPDELLDRARYGQYPPGSTFKLVTAMAALRRDPEFERRRFHCAPLRGGRVGAIIPGWRRPIRDDAGDPAHGSPEMARALAVSCNAYFAQLGVHAVGADGLLETARLLEIPAGEPKQLAETLPFAAYGQGPVLMTPFKMARVVAAIAGNGELPQGRWIADETNPRDRPPQRVVSERAAAFVAAAMRGVVISGTARRPFAGLNVAVAGKTGTAQVEGRAPHSWFTGFAPYEAPPSDRIAFAVVVEHGGYGSQAAAPIARELVEAMRDLGLVKPVSTER